MLFAQALLYEIPCIASPSVQSGGEKCNIRFNVVIYNIIITPEVGIVSTMEDRLNPQIFNKWDFSKLTPQILYDVMFIKTMRI